MPNTAPFRDFWRRTSEGLSAEQLWNQLRRETGASLKLYSAESGRDLRADWSAKKIPFGVVGAVAAAMFKRLTPVRRVLLLIAVACLLIPRLEITTDTGLQFSLPFSAQGALLLLVLLALELADRVGLKRDLEIARDIQMMLLPAEPPVVPGIDVAFATKPANTVAGDYYDAFPRPDDGRRMLFIVADVAGKGIPAGLLMATVQSGFHMLAEERLPLSAIAARLNRSMFRRSGSGRHFTTAFLAELNLDTRELLYVNAGHNAPLLVRASGAIEQPEEGGLPLGMFERSQYESGTTMLNAGDALYVYTDGVVEAFNSAGVEFGESRLAELCRTLPDRPAQASLDRILQSVEQFAAGEPRSDDITCLIVRSEAERAVAASSV